MVVVSLCIRQLGTALYAHVHDQLALFNLRSIQASPTNRSVNRLSQSIYISMCHPNLQATGNIKMPFTTTPLHPWWYSVLLITLKLAKWDCYQSLLKFITWFKGQYLMQGKSNTVCHVKMTKKAEKTMRKINQKWPLWYLNFVIRIEFCIILYRNDCLNGWNNHLKGLGRLPTAAIFVYMALR